MTRPRVVVHSLVSVDGCLDGVPADLALYYDLAGRFPQQAVLSGSGTIVAAAEAAGIDALEDAPRRLQPTAVQQLRDGHIWLRYLLES